MSVLYTDKKEVEEEDHNYVYDRVVHAWSVVVEMCVHLQSAYSCIYFCPTARSMMCMHQVYVLCVACLVYMLIHTPTINKQEC